MTRSQLGRGQLKMIARPGAKDVLAAKKCASEHGQASLPSLCFWFFWWTNCRSRDSACRCCLRVEIRLAARNRVDMQYAAASYVQNTLAANQRSTRASGSCIMEHEGVFCRSKKGPAALKGDTAEEILAMLSNEDTAHRGPLTLEGGVARVMKKLLDQERPMLICSEMCGAHSALISCV